MPTIDSLITLADGLVAALTAEGVGLSQSITAQWKADPETELSNAEIRTPLVWVVDLSQKNETTADGVSYAEYELLVVVQKKIIETESLDSVVRSMSLLTSEITEFCRSAEIEIGDDVAICTGISRPLARDFDRLRHEQLYRADFVATWKYC